MKTKKVLRFYLRGLNRGVRTARYAAYLRPGTVIAIVIKRKKRRIVHHRGMARRLRGTARRLRGTVAGRHVTAERRRGARRAKLNLYLVRKWPCMDRS